MSEQAIPTDREMPAAGRKAAHRHAHHHHGHHHGPLMEGGTANQRRVLFAMLLTGGFMVAEVIGGLLSGSLALLADAGHMLTDSAALALAWLAFRVAQRPADARRSFGYRRFEVLAAFANALALFAIVAWILFEAVQRLLDPVEIHGAPMLGVATIGLLVNIVAFLILHRGQEQNLNIRGASMHVLSDLLGSVAAIMAALVILATGWTPVDPILSVIVALLIIRSAWKLLQQSTHILLEGTPEEIDRDAIYRHLTEAIPEVIDVHHIHAWSLSDSQTVMTLHAQISEQSDQSVLLERMKALLAQQFNVSHATIQFEFSGCPDRH